jgi:putative SOS response-associated peptidase YedK
VEPNEVLVSVGHHRSPALLIHDEDCLTWLEGSKSAALSLLQPSPNETMGVEPVAMGIKIPGNQAVELPAPLLRRI